MNDGTGRASPRRRPGLHRHGTATGATASADYFFVVVVVLVDSEVLDDVGGAGDAGGAGVAEGAVVVVESVRVDVVLSRDCVLGGDAEGAGLGVIRSRSVTRSVRSVQPATRPAPSTRAQTPVSNFCIMVPPRGIGIRVRRLQRGCRRPPVE